MSGSGFSATISAITSSVTTTATYLGSQVTIEGYNYSQNCAGSPTQTDYQSILTTAMTKSKTWSPVDSYSYVKSRVSGGGGFASSSATTT